MANGTMPLPRSRMRWGLGPAASPLPGDDRHPAPCAGTRTACRLAVRARS
jgi:hypothetical protein